MNGILLFLLQLFQHLLHSETPAHGFTFRALRRIRPAPVLIAFRSHGTALRVPRAVGPNRLTRSCSSSKPRWRSPQESTRVWTGWMPMAQGFQARSPRIHRFCAPGKTPLFRPGSERRRKHDHHHARDTARSRAEHLLRAMAGRKSRCLRASDRQPLPIMGSLRAPESCPLTVRSEISQGIARRRVGKFCVGQKRKISAPGDGP